MSKQDNRETRILIVDDDPVSRTVMAEILRPEGYDIHTVSDGRAFIDQLPAVRPDVILMDVLMPKIDGLELCRRIKADQHWQHVPIILVTSLNRDEELVAGLDAGADEFLSKPVAAAELRARVRSMRRVKQRADLLIGMAQMRADLAHMVVHDMRTPLTVCTMRTDLLLGLLEKGRLQTQPSPQLPAGFSLKRSLRIIRDQLEELSSQVDEVLLMARTEQDRIVLNGECADLGDIVRRVADSHKELARRDEITLRVQTPPAACQRQLDVNLTTRLVANLLGNALKFSPPHSTITLRLAPDADGRSCLLQVADEGPGIPVADRERIFDRYVVASKSGRHMRSFGLGLAFCKMVAEAHGGSITVRDNAPAGTVFDVRL